MGNKRINPVDNIERLAIEYKKVTNGYRITQYGIFQEIMASVIEMRSNPTQLRKFVKRNDIVPPKNTKSHSWITEAAFSLATTRERAWKISRACEFLIDYKKVPLAKLSMRLKKDGGTEKIIRQAAIEDSKQPKSAPRKKEAGDRTLVKHPSSVNKPAARYKKSESDDWDEIVDIESKNVANSEYAYLTVQVRRSRLVKILALSEGQKFDMICRRRDPNSDDDIQVAVTKHTLIES